MGPKFFTCTFVDFKLSTRHCVGITIVGALNIMGEKISWDRDSLGINCYVRYLVLKKRK